VAGEEREQGKEDRKGMKSHPRKSIVAVEKYQIYIPSGARAK